MPRPTRVAVTPMRNVCHVVSKLPGRAKAVSHPPEVGCPEESGHSAVSPLQVWPQGYGQAHPVPSGSGSRRLQNRFSSQPRAASLSPRRPDPRSGNRIKDRLWVRAGSSSKALGYAGGSSLSAAAAAAAAGGRAGRWAPVAPPVVVVDYNGSLCRRRGNVHTPLLWFANKCWG
jgi:hypothetical protein